MKKTTGYLRLMRPANIVTSVADVLAGIAISGLFTTKGIHPEILSDRQSNLNKAIGWGWDITNITWWVPVGHASVLVLLLCLATIGLYGGGVVFNDVFDAGLDKIERPERPIPSGLITIQEASLLGSILLLGGILAAFFSNSESGIIAFLIAIAALVYNRWGKHNAVVGPLNMGLCRGLNLLLGISIIPWAVGLWWGLAVIPIIYIASITMISRGEVHGGSKTILYFACLLYSLVIGFIVYFSIRQGTIWYSIIFLLAFAWMIFKPLIRAIGEPVGKNIGKAVKAGVIALILMNAAWAAAFGAVYAAIIIVLLLPISMKLGKMFAVT